MNSFFLDTSVIIDYLRGKDAAVRLVNGFTAELSSSYICLSELYEGVYRVDNPKEAEKVVANFFQGLSKIYDIDWETARQFGKIRSTLKKQGRVIEDLDLLIAATCIVHSVTLVTFNREHFSRISHLQLLDLP